MTGSNWLFAPGRVPDLHQTSATTKVPGAIAASDLLALGSLLQDTYARFDDYAKKGLDVQALVRRHADRVRDLPSIRIIDAFGPCVKELRAAVPDNHFNTVVEGLFAELHDPSIWPREYRGPSAALDQAQRAAGAIAATAQRIPTVDAEGRLGHVTGSIVAQGMEGAEQLRALGYRAVEELAPSATLVPRDDAPYSFRVVDGTGVIRLPDFDSSDPAVAASLESFVTDAPKHRALPRLVIDMRGNGGGQDTQLTEWARSFRAGGSVLADSISTVRREGRPHAISIWNGARTMEQYAPHEGDTQDMVKWAESTRSLWPLSASTHLPIDHHESPPTGTGKTDWTGEMYVLVDRRNGSAGETAALKLRDMVGATLVGERTAGALFGLNVATYELPGTKVSVPVPSAAASCSDPRVVEGGGIPVDLALENPGMPIDAFVRSLPPLQDGRSSAPRRDDQ